MGISNPFDSLNPSIQKWVYKQHWTDLRDIQKEAIPVILGGNHDVIISATTAAGKTEAAFLPACSAIADLQDGIGILYISPLKALINDQHRRLESLCELLNMPVTPWHGDIAQSIKKKCKSNPRGILLITPESLESLMIRDAGWLSIALEALKYIIIDEYHSFIGSERGCQLQSLMHRLESLLHCGKKPIPRIALSATLGDMDQVMEYLRPNNKMRCYLVKSNSNNSSLKMQIKGYLDSPPSISKNIDQDESYAVESIADQRIADDLYKILRGDSHLIFANSRRRTEMFCAILSDICEKNYVPNEFFPHHGSLSKESRNELESRLQKEHLPTTAVCTMTLELGIDIGKVNSVAQVTAPHSVASLRQRMGRSGRRGNASILRMFISEEEINSSSHLSDRLRLELLQSIAIVRLMIGNKWYEPADTNQLHLSTLLHQILAVIAQWGGVRVDQLWNLLCKTGPFNKVNVDQFKMMLRKMGEEKLILQLTDGLLVLGENGENLVDHYTFYAVFNTPEEYRLENSGKTLGSLPIDFPVLINQHIIFSGRRWKVTDIDIERKVISVTSAKGGKPPKFGGCGMSIHNKVRQEMFEIYKSGDHRISVGDSKIEYLDSTALQLFKEGCSFFKVSNLDKSNFYIIGKTVYIIPWLGDKIVNTLSTVLVGKGHKVTNYSGIIEILDVSKDDILSTFKEIVEDPKPVPRDLANLVLDKCIDKFDSLLSDQLLCENYAAKVFDIDNSYAWISEFLKYET
jgi:ATP-dependent helicase Lhr and Lhr-like helicase